MSPGEYARGSREQTAREEAATTTTAANPSDWAAVDTVEQLPNEARNRPRKRPRSPILKAEDTDPHQPISGSLDSLSIGSSSGSGSIAMASDAPPSIWGPSGKSRLVAPQPLSSPLSTQAENENSLQVAVSGKLHFPL